MSAEPIPLLLLPGLLCDAALWSRQLHHLGRERGDTDERRTRRRVLLDLSRRDRFKGVTPRLLPSYLHPDRVAEPEPGGMVMAVAERLGPKLFLRHQRAIMHRPDRRDLLPHIAAPTLGICGREDTARPLDHSTEMASSSPGARLAVIEECGHLSPLERPQAVTALLRLWLEGALP